MPHEVHAVVAAKQGAPVELQTILVPDPGPGDVLVAGPPPRPPEGTGYDDHTHPARAGRGHRPRCPYHAWTYDLDGRLVAAPNLQKIPDVDRTERGLVTVPLREWLGYAWVCLADEPPSFEDTQDRRYYAITVRPQVFVNLVPDHVIVHRMFPMAPDRTVVECDWLYLPEVVDSGADVSKSVALFHRVNAQDFDACERTQPAMSSRAYRAGGVLVPSEHHIGVFHRWVTDRLAGEGA
ncbi:SRPBCC family protein [Streptomyces sioyaensis]|uniref:aromatic ring-hydroxylating oxygenase subunit alpha n=1 Tax=Streptomyces sioyaensis TaxID=67364 RepID=UPI00379A2270